VPFIGLDVHKDTIAWAVALPGRASPEYRGEFAHQPKTVSKWLARLSTEFDGAVLPFCYEAGPCGYGLYRELIAAGHDCQVVAPSLIPKKPGAQGTSTAQRLCAASRPSLATGRKTRWTQAQINWLESIRFEQPWLQIVLQEYIDAVKAAKQRVDNLTDQLMQILPSWSLAPVVDALVALRGIDKLAATVLLTERGDISRFDSPKQLTAYLGLAPSEHSSGGCRSSVPGAIAFQRARRCTSSARPPLPRPGRLPGGRRNACVAATAGSRRRARTSSWSVSRLPASWWASFGISYVRRCPA